MMKKNVASAEVEVAALKDQKRLSVARDSERTAASVKIDALFQEAVEKGEMNGDIVLIDEQGEEIESAEPRRTIFDL